MKILHKSELNFNCEGRKFQGENESIKRKDKKRGSSTDAYVYKKKRSVNG